MKMRVRVRIPHPHIPHEPKELSLASYVANIATGEYEDRHERSGGALERLEENIERTALFLGRVMERMYQRGLLTDTELTQMIEVPFEHRSITIDQVDTDSSDVWLD